MRFMLSVLICSISFCFFGQSDWGFKKDKQLHLSAGLIISGTASTLSKRPILYGVSFSAIAGAGKEFYDSFTHKPSIEDFTYTIVGGVIGSVIVFYAKRYFNKENKLPLCFNKKQ